MMKHLNRLTDLRLARSATVLAVAAFVVAGCAATEPQRAPAQLESAEDFGFTISEDARVASDVQIDYQSALAHLEQGRQAEGVALLESVVEKAPELTAPRIDLGIAYHRAGNLEAAERQLRLALESNPNHPVAYNELGIVYRKGGRFEEARRSYEAALAIYPGFHYARRNLAVLCDLYLADPVCALENYEAYMSTVPSDEEATMWIADLRARHGQEVE